MNPVRFEPEPATISVNKKEILNLLERSGDLLDQHTIEMMDALIPRCTLAARPSGGFLWIDPVSVLSGNALQIGKERFNVGPDISKKMRNAKSVVVFAVTAGHGPERLARELMSQGGYLEGFMTDLIGTAIVEWAAEQVHQQIRAQASLKGWKVTNRYSPGYCSWNVEEQQKLFRLIPSELCDIALSESSLMTPIKSVIGIIGTGPRVRFSANSCSLCPMKECVFRRIDS